MSAMSVNVREIFCMRGNETHRRAGEGSFLRLKDNSILYVFSRFDSNSHDNASSNLMAIRSTDEGETWTEPVTAIAASDYGVINVMSVSLIEMRNGDVGLFYIVKYTPGEDRIMLSRSSDGGRTWYSHTECTLADRRGYYVLNNDRVVRLASGRLIVPLAFHRSSNNRADMNAYVDHRAYCFFLLSDDDGATWRESRDGVYPPFTGTRSGLQEPGVVELAGGVVQAYFRTDKMYHYEAFSFDGGDTWTVAQPSRFTGPCSPLLIKNVAGRRFAVWNPVPGFNGRVGFERTPMVIAECVNGQWTDPTPLMSAEQQYCYPALLEVKGGMLVAYMACDRDGDHMVMQKIEW